MRPDAVPAGALRTAPILFAAALAATAAAPPPTPPAGLDEMVAERIEGARRAVTATPERAEAWLELGALFHAHELTDRAADCYRQAAAREPDDARTHYLLAHAEWELGDPEPAVERLERVVELAPGYAPASWRRGGWLLELGRMEEAEAAFARAAAADPGAAAPAVGLARVHLARRQPERAIPLLERVLAAEPTHGQAAQLLGAALRQAGREEAARRILRATTGTAAADPDPWLDGMRARATGVGNILRRLSAEIERGVVEPAVEELAALRASHPRHVGLLNKLAEAELARGRPEAALDALRDAVAVDPEEFATLIHLAQAERMRGDTTAALEWASRAVLANPRLWHGHFERAGLLCAAGRWRECLGSADLALDRGGHPNPNLWLLRGEALLRLEEWQEAAETFSRAAARFPFQDQAFVGLAYARLEQGRLDEARAALDAAAELAPPTGTAAALRARLAELAAAGREDR
ncbi:MAG: tetratricopeptide repeat protein [Thermoanaerobaculia bacterium]|nr:tetratricopeptide repeat protein [Thermoanaerobaculia bacterium]